MGIKLYFLKRISLILFVIILAGCELHDDSNESEDNGNQAGGGELIEDDPTPSEENSPTISASLPVLAFPEETLNVQVQIEGFGDGVEFSLINAPGWMSIHPQTGILTAIPTAQDVATYNDITIVAIDAQGQRAELTISTLTVPALPEITLFTASRLTLVEGESVVIAWNTENTDSVSITPLIGETTQAGEANLSPAETTEFILSATSAEGRTVQQSLTVTVNSLVSVAIESSVSTGFAPLTTNLTPIYQTQDAVNRLYWDFEGDGGVVDGGLGTDENGFDQIVSLLSGRLLDFDSTGRSFAYTYEEPGTYTVRLRIWDGEDNQTDASVTIDVLNAPPDVAVSADKTNGEAPLTVTFSLTATDNEGISTFRWDFDGDGNVDQDGPAMSVTHLFESPGEYQVTVEAVDILGASQSIALPHIAIRAKPEGTSSVSLTATPAKGEAPLSVNLLGTAQVPSGSPITGWQWDFDGDGEIDEETENGTLLHVYESPGAFYLTVNVLTEDGDIATDIKEIIVEPDLSLMVQGATFNPESEESASIQTTFSGTYSVQLDIVNRDDAVVRTLVPWEERTSGVYSDIWDGKDDQGTPLPPGPYFALLRYLVNGEENVLDLRSTSAGQLLYPGWCSRGLANCGTLTIPSNNLEPFNHQPWVYKFTSNYIADFTAYMSIFTTNELMTTFFTRRPFGTQGTHEIVWNGEDTNGTLLPSVSTVYLITILGETLGNNALFLDHGVRVHDFRAEPAVLYPNRQSGTLTVTLSRPSQLELWVSDAQNGGEVFRTLFERQESGEVTLTWDGKNNSGIYLAPGEYRVSLHAIDDFGYVSQSIHAMQRINY